MRIVLWIIRSLYHVKIIYVIKNVLSVQGWGIGIKRIRACSRAPTRGTLSHGGG